MKQQNAFSHIQFAILDLDGTILDSMSAWKNVTRDYLASLGIKARADIREKVKHLTSEENALYLQKDYGLTLSSEEIITGLHETISKKYESEIPLKNSGKEILAFLKKHKIPFCAATSTDKHLILPALKRLDIYDDFSFILTCAEVGKGKHFPDIYLESAKRMNVSPAHTAVFEDALHCVETAKKAGFFVVGVYEAIDASDWKKIVALCDFAWNS